MQLSLRLQEDILKSVKEFRNNQKEVRKKVSSVLTVVIATYHM